MALKTEFSSRVSEILEEPQYSPQIMTVLLKMGKLLAKKKDLKNNAPVRVMDRLWVGNYHFANCRSFLEQNRIQNVVSCLDFDLGIHLQHINYLKMPLKDGPDSRFEETVLDFCHFMRNNSGTVYLHCFSGISRSPALLLSLLISQQQTFSQALQNLRKIYPKAQPNPYFLQTLQRIASKLLPRPPVPPSQNMATHQNLLGHKQQLVSSPRNSEEKRLAIEIKKEENLLDFEGSSHSNGDPTNIPEPLFSLINIQLAGSASEYKQSIAQVASKTKDYSQLLDIDLSPQKQVTESPSLLLDTQEFRNKQAEDFSSNLLDLGQQPSSLSLKVQEGFQKQEESSKQTLGYEASNSEIESVPFNLQIRAQEGNLASLGLAHEKPIESQIGTPSLLPNVAQSVPKQQETVVAGEKQEEFTDPCNFTQKKVKNKKKKR